MNSLAFAVGILASSPVNLRLHKLEQGQNTQLIHIQPVREAPYSSFVPAWFGHVFTGDFVVLLQAHLFWIATAPHKLLL